MAAKNSDALAPAALNASERETIRNFAARLRALRALWLYGSRARGEAHAESDIDLLVIAEGGRDRYQRVALDLSEDAANDSNESPFSYSVHVHDLQWLEGVARSSPSSFRR